MPMPRAASVAHQFKEQLYKTATLRCAVSAGNFTFEKGHIVSVCFKRMRHCKERLGQFEAIYSIMSTKRDADGTPYCAPAVPESALERFVL